MTAFFRRNWRAVAGLILAAGSLFGARPAQADTYRYAATLGVTGVDGSDNAHFFNPAPGAVDTSRGRLYIADRGNDRVQVYDTATLAYLATIGVTDGVVVVDNSHFNQPSDVAFDAANNHILVADYGNSRIQVFDAETYAYLATIGASGQPGADNTHLSQPASVKINPKAGQIYVADTGNRRVQIFNAQTLSYGASLTMGSGGQLLYEPSDAEYNPALNQIMVTDVHYGVIQLYDATYFSPLFQLTGGSYGNFETPVSVGFDPVSNLVLVADSGTQTVQANSAATYRDFSTLGTYGTAGVDNGAFSAPRGVVADPVHGQVFVGDANNMRVQVYKSIPSPLVASLLPGARSVELGATPTVFANMLNLGQTALSGCYIAVPTESPLALSFQTTDPATNALTGFPNAVVSLPAAPPGGYTAQTFVLTFSTQAAFEAVGQPLEFSCAGVAPASVVPGVNTADLIFSPTPVADVIVLAATIQNDGIVHVPLGGTGAFAVASTNIGTTASLTATLDTGAATLPLTAKICQTGAGGQCQAPPAGSLPLSFAAGTTPTFSIFVTAADAIPLAPATSRLFLRFVDSFGLSHGATSVAVETQ
jgi:YVTN family beta-propeller protein